MESPPPAPRRRALPAVISLLALGAACAHPAPAPAAPGFDTLPPRLAECEHGARGSATTRPGDSVVGPLHMPGPDVLGSHWNPATRLFTSKAPLVVVGSRAVTVRVPERLAGRLVLSYGRRGKSGEYRFVPCGGRRATFWPGGMAFTRREPISLLVQVDGWPRPRLLRLGAFPPYPSIFKSHNGQEYRRIIVGSPVFPPV